MTDTDRLVANSIKGLAMDAVQKANSGHPGMPMGMADAAWVLWSRFLKHDPSDPTWADRDRFVLSGGHGSMLLYSLLHLFDYRDEGGGEAVSMGEIKDFRQWGSRTPGHPEYGHTAGVETTTGPLGQGVSMAVGMALAERWLRERFGAQVCDHFTWSICGDGDLMEGVAAEAVSLVCCKTHIGHGSPNKQDTSAAHGAPLGADEIVLTKQALGLDPELHFHVPQAAYEAARALNAERATSRLAWEQRLDESGKRAHWEAWHSGIDVDDIEWPSFPVGGSIATRKSSAAALNAAVLGAPNLLGGSADLAGSNGTNIKGGEPLTATDFSGNMLHFGVREHAMAALCNGMSLHGGVRPYCATFLVFHDYMRPAVRLSGLMNQPVIYVYTHDSIYLGEDGPTHQPVEHLMAMRLIPNLWTIRPADAKETVGAWKVALRREDGPVALSLTRQDLPTLETSSAEAVSQGAYVLVEAEGRHALTLLASGSEVELALRARDVLQAQGVGTRLVSFPCWELFEAQQASYRAEVLGQAPRLSVEAGTTFGWSRYAQAHVGHDDFGASAPAEVLAEKFGFTVDNVVATAQALLG